jgi:hypothetical protein
VIAERVHDRDAGVVGADDRCRCKTGRRNLVVGSWIAPDRRRHAVTTPPDFGGREIEEGLLEDLGGPREEHSESNQDEDSTWSDNEARAPGRVCELCGAVITVGQDVRRRADGQWMHEICP